MSAMLMNIVVQLIAGAIGGNAAGSIMKNLSLGTLGNTVAGAAGGVGGGFLLQSLLPGLMQAAESGGVDIAALGSQAVGGGVAGLVLTAIIGALKNRAAA